MPYFKVADQIELFYTQWGVGHPVLFNPMCLNARWSRHKKKTQPEPPGAPFMQSHRMSGPSPQRCDPFAPEKLTHAAPKTQPASQSDTSPQAPAGPCPR